MFYDTSFFRVVRRVLFAAGFCALVVPVSQADTVTIGGEIYWAIDYDGCTPTNVVMEYSCVWADGNNPYWNEDVNGHYWNGPFVASLKPGENPLGPIGAASDSTLAWKGQNVIIGGYNGANVPAGALPVETGNNGFGINTTPCSESYSATIPNPCANANNGCNTVDQFAGGQNTTNNNGSPYGQVPASGFNYTNETGSPQVLPDGNVLQPGQAMDSQWNYNEGQNDSFSVSNLNNEGLLQDTGNYTILSNETLETSSSPATGANSEDLLSSNGPIIWQPGLSQTQADEAGFSQLANGQNQQMAQQQQEFSNLLNALANQHLNLSPSNLVISNAASGVGSNVWVQNWPSNDNTGGTNTSTLASNVWVQNWPTNIDTNTALAMTFANTNQAGSIVTPVSQQATTLSGMVPNSLADNAGAAEEQDITITPASAPHQVTIAMGVLPATLSTTFTQIREVIAWFVVVLLAIWNFVSLFRTIKDVSQVPQGQGPDTGAWAAIGSNIVTALAVASAIVAVISTIPVFAVGLLAGELSFVGNYSGSSPLNFFNQMGWGFQFLSQYLPIYLMFTSFGVRVVYYFGLEVLAFFACIVIKLLIGV